MSPLLPRFASLPWQPRRLLLVVLWLVLLLLSATAAMAEEQNSARHNDKAEQDSGPSISTDTPIGTTQFQLQLSRPADRSVEQKHERWQFRVTTAADQHWQFQHDYRVLDLPAINGIEAASNGHLHDVALAFTANGADWQLRLQPTLSTSSNALRESEQLRARDLQWQGEWRFLANSSASTHWSVGVRADDQLGRYRGYLSGYWRIAVVPDWQLQIGYPNSELRWQINDALQTHWFVAANGGQWHVYDKTFAHDSELRLQQWQLGWRFDWRWPQQHSLRLQLQLSRDIEQRLHYRLQNAERATMPLEDVTRIQFGASWTF